MNRILSLFLFSSLLFFLARADVDGGDPLIHQVVDGGDEAPHHHHHHDNHDGEQMLGAEHYFSLFKRKFGKSYASQEEHNYSFKVFKTKMRRAKRHQRMDPTAQHGVTRFSYFTPATFRRSHLGLRGLRLLADANTVSILSIENLPEDFDWREHGAITEVKN